MYNRECSWSRDDDDDDDDAGCDPDDEEEALYNEILWKENQIHENTQFIFILIPKEFQ